MAMWTIGRVPVVWWVRRCGLQERDFVLRFHQGYTAGVLGEACLIFCFCHLFHARLIIYITYTYRAAATAAAATLLETLISDGVDARAACRSSWKTRPGLPLAARLRRHRRHCFLVVHRHVLRSAAGRPTLRKSFLSLAPPTDSATWCIGGRRPST